MEQEKKRAQTWNVFLLGTGSKEDELDSDDLDDDDEEDDEEEEKDEGSSDHAEMNGTETLDCLKKYMDEMDHELMSTNIGHSFSQMVIMILIVPSAYLDFEDIMFF